VAVNRTMTGLEWSLLVILSLLWGGTFLLTGIAVRELPPFTLVALRVGLAAVILNGVVVAAGFRMPTAPRIWLNFAGMGLLNNLVPFCLIVWGQTHIASGLASILNATTPLWTVLVAHVLTNDERATANRLAGVAFGFVGVATMIGVDAMSGLGGNVIAECAVLAAALSYACAGIFGRRFRAFGLPPLVAATGQISAAALILAPVALFADRPWTLQPSAAALFATFALALFSTAIAYVLYFRILATAGATNLMLVTFLIPVSALVLGTLILKEPIYLKHLFGMLMIGLGLGAIDGRVIRWFARAASP
jgi:drug/metabolite transporter (DMT)-like permease